MDIPEDVRRSAIAALDAYRNATGASLLVAFEDQVGAVSMAILAERERAARVCEHQAHAFLSPDYTADIVANGAEVIGWLRLALNSGDAESWERLERFGIRRAVMAHHSDDRSAKVNGKDYVFP